jgi:hypothetical protein
LQETTSTQYNSDSHEMAVVVVVVVVGGCVGGWVGEGGMVTPGLHNAQNRYENKDLNRILMYRRKWIKQSIKRNYSGWNKSATY